MGDEAVGEPDEFFAAHGQALLRFAFLLTGGRGSDAEDLVQAVFARLVARGFDRLADPVSYARRSILNEYRSAGRRASVEVRAYPRLVAGHGQAGTRSRYEDRQAMLDALGAVTERERAAVVLRYYEDLPDDEIAALLGCSRSTVRSLIHRALPKLRSRLGDAYGAGDAEARGSSRRGGADD